MMPAIPKTKKPTTKVKEKKVTAEVAYPEVKSTLYSGGDPLTVEMAKEFLGWEEETEAVKFGDSYTLTDHRGVKIRCTNNDTNRPFNQPWAERLGQDMLNQRWKLNGETIIVSKHGKVLSGQHRLIGLVLAEQLRVGAQAEHWADKWKGPVTIETIVVTGADEDAETTTTLDNTRPRSDTDILYTDTTLFSKHKGKKRVDLCSRLAWSVKLLWQRTGEDKDAFHGHRTSSETRDFVLRHKRLTEMVVHVCEEDEGQKGNLSAMLSPGYMAALAYLCAASKTDGEKYRSSDPRSEKKIDFSMWDKAQEYVVDLAAKAPSVAAVFGVKRPMPGDEKGKHNTKLFSTTDAKFSERLALLINAWGHYGTEFTPGDIKLDYNLETAPDGEGVVRITEATPYDLPTLEGIDMNPDEAEEQNDPPAPEPEEIAEKVEEIKNGKHAPKVTETKPNGEKITEAPILKGTDRQKWEAMKARYPNYLLFVKHKSGNVFALGEDAVDVAKACKLKEEMPKGSDLTRCKIPNVGLEEAAQKMAEEGHRVGLVEEVITGLKDGVGVSKEKFTPYEE